MVVSVLSDPEIPDVMVRWTLKRLMILSYAVVHLPELQKAELIGLINQFLVLFSDMPLCTNLIEHDIDVGDTPPIKKQPCRGCCLWLHWPN